VGFAVTVALHLRNADRMVESAKERLAELEARTSADEIQRAFDFL